MNTILQLTPVQVGLAYVFVLLVLLFLRLTGIRREKELLISSIRMTLQLILVGYLLVWVFANPHPLITILIIVIMESFAVFTIWRKFRKVLTRELTRVIAGSMAIGTLSCITYFLLIVVQATPWFNPQYFIPIAGMMIGNSMTGISLAVKNLTEGMTVQRNIVEEALVLGATPRDAAREIMNGAFDAAILPTIHSMVGMGIVFLPGMMTGQILSGTDPTTAIAYQIAIMLGILGSVSITVFLMIQFGYKTFFNAQQQLRP